MKLKSLLLAVGFIPTMVMAQTKLATPPVIEKPVGLNPPAKSAGGAGAMSVQQYQKPPVPVVPASTMSELVLPALESARDAANRASTNNKDRGSASKQ
jgi:hypothetical protein